MSEEIKILDALSNNDTLQEEVTRLRETNTMLRRVNHALRRTLDSLRNQVANATENDDTFRRFCEENLTLRLLNSGTPDWQKRVRKWKKRSRTLTKRRYSLRLILAKGDRYLMANECDSSVTWDSEP